MMYRLLTFLGLSSLLLLSMTACTVTPAVAPTLVPETEQARVDAECSTLQALNFRFGPGLSYEPPVRTLAGGTPLVPLAFVPAGQPDGQWLQVRNEANGETGYVSVGSQFISCDIDLTSLPPAKDIPPTPEPAQAPTDPPPPPTPVEIAVAPPRVNNNAPGGTASEHTVGEVLVDDSFLFRIRVADTNFGNHDGDGIDHVDYTVRTLDGDIVYEHRENVAGYCVFGGGEPNCNPWFVRDGKNVWGPDGPEMQPGDYHVTILVFPREPEFDGEVWNWDFDFTLSAP